MPIQPAQAADAPSRHGPHPPGAASAVASARLPLELMGQIIDLSESARDVVRWLYVSKDMASQAKTAPAFSQRIEWPPQSCTMPMPDARGLEHMVRGARVSRGIELRIKFSAGVSAQYILDVMRFVSDSALPLTTSLTVHFCFCFALNREPPCLGDLLDRPAPRLKDLHIGAHGKRPQWHDANDVRLFDGVAPQLSALRLTGINAPMRRMPAFDAVRLLDIQGCQSYPSLHVLSQSILVSCANLQRLMLRCTGPVCSLEPTASVAHSRARVAQLAWLDFFVQHVRPCALRLLELLAHDGMDVIRAYGDNNSAPFPAGFTAAVMRTLPELAANSIELLISYRQASDGSHFFCIAFALREPDREREVRKQRLFAIAASSPSPTAQVRLLGQEILAAGRYSYNVTDVRVAMALFPLLVELYGEQQAPWSFARLRVRVDDFDVRLGVGQHRVSMPLLESVAFDVPSRHAALFDTNYGLYRAVDVVCRFVDYDLRKVSYSTLISSPA